MKKLWRVSFTLRKKEADAFRFRARSRRSITALTYLLFVASFTPLAFGQAHSAPQISRPVESGPPAALKQVGIDQRLNEQLPLDTVLKDEMGRPVQLGQFFGERPVILAFVYYECPMLCNQVLNGLLGSLKIVTFDAGKEFDVIALSFDPRENDKPGLAAEKKQSFINRYDRPGASNGWHFLTGDEAAIKRVTDAAGFHFTYDKATNQYAHASGIMIATPDGRLARYFYGIEYAPKDVKLGLIEASDRKIGSPVDALLLYCYHYDPSSGTYTAKVAMMLMQIGGVLTLIAFIGFYFFMSRRKKALGRMREAEV